MPAKKISAKVPISIHKEPKKNLMDERVLKRALARRDLSGIIALAAILGFLVGGVILGYLYFSKPKEQGREIPKIEIPVVPEDNQNQATTTPGSTAQTKPEEVTLVKEILVLDTPTGFLNVRAGAGTNFEKIGQVKPGETYEFISEDPGNGIWYQIKLADGKAGWVTRQYVRIK